MQKCVFLQMAWPCTHSGFTNNNVTVLYLRTCSSRGVLELGVFSLSVFRTFGGLLHYIWIYACALIPKRKTIFSFNFLIFFPAGLFKLIWKQSLEYFCISREVNIQLVLPFFFSLFLGEVCSHGQISLTDTSYLCRCRWCIWSFSPLFSRCASPVLPSGLQAGFCSQRT